MIALVLCVVAFLGTLAAARVSLGTGLAATMAVGYAYGIVRANLLSAPAHMLFDASVLGLYLGCGAQVLRTVRANPDARRLVMWVTLLMAWPTILAVLPGYDPLLQLVGWRGNAFLLPFLLIGAALTEADLKRLGITLALLNIAAFGVAVAEYLTDVRLFFPQSEVTRIIYASNDVAGYTAMRIPSTFANAHSYAGAMVLTVPVLLAILSRGSMVLKRLSAFGLAVAVVGVFLAAVRTPALGLLAMAGSVTLFGRLGKRVAAVWAGVLVVVALVVSSNERLQRFSSLQDFDVVSARISGSVNVHLVDLLTGNPLGNGLTGGGTSVPYFLQDRAASGSLFVENEFGRIGVEQGTVGLMLWLAFATWTLFAVFRSLGSGWFTSRLAAATAAAVALGAAFIGTGLLTAVPQSSLFLLWVGWLAVPFALPGNASVVASSGQSGAPSYRPGWQPRHGAA